MTNDKIESQILCLQFGWFNYPVCWIDLEPLTKMVCILLKFIYSERAMNLLQILGLQPQNNFGKVHVFWEGYKIFWNLNCRFDRYYKSLVEILQNFVAFSEYMIFNKIHTIFVKGSRSRQTIKIEDIRFEFQFCHESCINELSRILVFKVQIFWEDQKISLIFHVLFDNKYLKASNYKWKMGQTFVAFSEYLNFNDLFGRTMENADAQSLELLLIFYETLFSLPWKWENSFLHS